MSSNAVEPHKLSKSYRERLGLGAGRSSDSLTLLFPGAICLALGLASGGFFAGSTALAAAVVLVALALRLTLADSPLAGFGALSIVAALGLALFAGWTLLSGSWSDAPARALVEADRALLYVAVFLLVASVARCERTTGVVLGGLTGAGVVLCLLALLSRLFPDLVPSDPSVEPARLSLPLDYWNALGLLATMSVLGCLHLSSGERGSRVVRVLAAAAVPALIVTLYFTFSRGAIAAGIAGLLILLILGAHRGLLAGLLAVLPTSAVALTVAYGADRLASTQPLAEAASGEARGVALATGLSMLAAALIRLVLVLIEARADHLRIPRRAGRLRGAAALAVILLGGLGAALAADLPDRLNRQYERFVEVDDIKETRDTRERLSDAGNNGRLDEWRIALDAYRADRLTGHGAGTYEFLWARKQKFDFNVYDGHSLYLEVLGELGLVGLALLALGLGAIIAGIAARLRGVERPLYAALLAITVTWALHAGVDWDWEMPAVTIWPIALGAAALSRSADPARRPLELGRPLRVVAALGCLIVAVTPALLFMSQQRLDAAGEAFDRGDCATVVDEALAANRVLGVRPEPFELLAYCDVRLGRPELAVRAMAEAVRREPENWKLAYGTALVRGAAGLDPRPAARRALFLSPKDKLTLSAVKRFRTNDPRKWRRGGGRARLPMN